MREGLLVEEFKLEEWHVLVIFFTILFSVMKTDISNAIKFAIITREQRKNIGKQILMMQSTGEWKKILIVDYHYDIPFIRAGGIIINHLDEGEHFIHEKLSLINWSSHRVRY